MKNLSALSFVAVISCCNLSVSHAQVSNYMLLRAGADDLNLVDIARNYVTSKGELVEVVKKSFSNIKGAGVDFMSVGKKGHGYLEFGAFYKSTTILGTESSYQYDFTNKTTGQEQVVKAVGEFGLVRMGAGFNLVNIRKAQMNIGLDLSGFGEYGYLTNNVKDGGGSMFYTVPDTVIENKYIGGGFDARLNFIIRLDKEAEYLLLITPGYKFLWRQTTNSVNALTHTFEETNWLANITLGLARKF